MRKIDIWECKTFGIVRRFKLTETIDTLNGPRTRLVDGSYLSMEEAEQAKNKAEEKMNEHPR